jgi:hypothetical protein
MSQKKFFTTILAGMLLALTGCKNSVNETAEVIDLPQAETPDSVAKAMDAFFQEVPQIRWTSTV